ncbi:Cyclin-I2 [Plecturocebus cupreus]
MASGGLLSPQPSSSEVSAVQSPSRHPGAGLVEAALGFPLPPSPGEAPLPPSAQSRCPGTHQPGAASLSAPSSTGPLGPRRWTAPAGRTADRVPADAPAQASRPDAQSLKPRNLEGILDECRLLRYLQLAQDREARLWQGGKPQVPLPAAGPASRPQEADGLHLHPRSGALHLEAEPFPRCGLSRDARGWIHRLLSRRASCYQGLRKRACLNRGTRLRAKSGRADEICIAFEEVVQWLLRLQNNLYFSRSTFNLALTIFSRLLISVKVKEKYLHCATIASLRLAAKLNEENEVIPQINDFIKHYGSDYSPNELLRMELAILDTLHWDLYIGTPLDFLTVFHALVVLSWPHVLELLPQRNPSLHVASLTRQLQHCMAGHQLLQFKGSTLALVIITLELERLMPDWCAPISDLLKKAQSITNFTDGDAEAMLLTATASSGSHNLNEASVFSHNQMQTYCEANEA